MNGPGNVFSRPMRSPMTFSLDVVIDHLLPIRPVMSPTIPEMKLSGDAFLLQDAREALGFVHVWIVVTRAYDGLGLPQRREETIVVEIRKERERVHEVRVAVPFAIQPLRRVIRARHAHRLARYAGTPSHERERVERAERASSDDQVIHRVCVPDRGQDLLDEVPLVREVPSGAALRRGRLVVEGLAVDRIDAPELQPARVDPRRHVRDKAAVLPLIEATHRGRKDEYRSATVAEDEQLHVTTRSEERLVGKRWRSRCE